MKTVEIYQLDLDKCKQLDYTLAFMPMYYLKRKNIKFDFSLYDKVYTDYVEDNITLDDIFEKFNINRPDDFYGHSLSVSDLIIINNKIFYVDSFGFVLLEEEYK